MNFPNEVSCSILIDPRDLGNVIGGKNSIDPRDLTVLPDGFHPLGYGFVADLMMEFASARRAAREDGIDGPGWAERLDDGLSGLVKALRDRSGWSPGHPLDANAFHAGEGPRDERLVCRDLDGFADAGELAEENARLYGAPSVADLAETVWGCTSLEPVKVRHFGVNGFRGLEFSFRDGAETRMRAWQFDACPKVAAALSAALTYRCEKGFYMEAGCTGENGGVWGLSFDRKAPRCARPGPGTSTSASRPSPSVPRPRRWPRPAGRPPRPVTGCDRSPSGPASGPTRLPTTIHWSHHEHL